MPSFEEVLSDELENRAQIRAAQVRESDLAWQEITGIHELGKQALNDRALPHDEIGALSVVREVRTAFVELAATEDLIVGDTKIQTKSAPIEPNLLISCGASFGNRVDRLEVLRQLDNESGELDSVSSRIEVVNQLIEPDSIYTTYTATIDGIIVMKEYSLWIKFSPNAWLDLKIPARQHEMVVDALSDPKAEKELLKGRSTDELGMVLSAGFSARILRGIERYKAHVGDEFPPILPANRAASEDPLDEVAEIVSSFARAQRQPRRRIF